MALSDTTADPVDLRSQVVAASIRLFSAQGYEATTVDAIAAEAGVSRRTLFRQFRSKEDMIFADHEVLLRQVTERLAAEEAAGADPWTAVCGAAEIVFTHFRANRAQAVERLHIVARVPALRDRELVTTYRYQRVFEEFLRRRLPDVPPVHLVGYAAAITSAHNFTLRQMIRGDVDATIDRLRADLRRIRLALGSAAAGGDTVPEPGPTSITIVTYPDGTASEAITAAIAEHLRTRVLSEDTER
ncbi:MAG: helix-turn-helix domain-containing protein [Gordonia sp. (in: high G+C Gram-positive bacteria)]